MNTLAILLAAGVVAQGATDEELLRLGHVVARAPVGEGITHSEVLTLEYQGRRGRALFKSIEDSFDGPYPFGTETADRFRDSCRFEIAAYQLDRMLGLGLVPVTVPRTIDGISGSLQLWIEDVMPRWGHGEAPPEPDDARAQAHAIRLLDYLIFNTDRHLRNVAFRTGWRPFVIDHSIAFRSFEVPSRPLHRFPAPVVARLQEITRADLEQWLDGYLDGDELDGLESRIERVRRTVGELLSERGPERTLFDWPAATGVADEARHSPARSTTLTSSQPRER